MNAKLVESLEQIIQSLSQEERTLLETKLFWDDSIPSPRQIMQLAERGGSLDFLHDDPDLYTLEDGEPI
jgi:hypothetical protein